jgi:hypothetical protein
MTTTETSKPPPGSPGNRAPARPGQGGPARPAPAAACLPSGPAVSGLSSSQLRGYRRELEHALKTLPAHAPVRALLARHLAAVRGEQDTRALAAAARPAGPAR